MADNQKPSITSDDIGARLAASIIEKALGVPVSPEECKSLRHSYDVLEKGDKGEEGECGCTCSESQIAFDDIAKHDYEMYSALKKAGFRECDAIRILIAHITA